jgi:hypothetical protein
MPDSPSPTPISEADGGGLPEEIFNNALAYIRPQKTADSAAPVNLNAGMLRCCVSAILAHTLDLESALSAALARAERLEKALEPFEKLATMWEVMTNHGTSIVNTPSGPTWLACGLNIRVDDIRAAADALASPIPSEEI